MTLGLLSGRGYTDSYTSCSISCSRLTSLCSFAQAAVSAVWHASSAFDSTFPFLFHCLRRPLRATLTTRYQLPLRLKLRNVAVRLPRVYFPQHGYSTNMNVFTVRHTNTYIHIYIQIHTYIQCIYGATYEYIQHTYIQTPLAFNMLMWGSLRLAPIIGKHYKDLLRSAGGSHAS